MPNPLGRYAEHFVYSAKTALVGPQVLAFVPALTLIGYWFGGEAVLLFMAIALPALLGLVGLFTPMRSPGYRDRAADSITRLPLRDALIRNLDQGFGAEDQTGLRSAALALEIDEFEQYRAQYGDAAADRILVAVAERITALLRESDLVARVEGGLFNIALGPSRRTDLETMIQVASRLQSVIADPVVIDGARLYLTACVGFCVPRRASERTGEACLEAAETALAEAQGSGVSAIRAYSPQPRRKRVLRAGLVGEVADALENGQVKPWFQPQISTDTGDITGVEALARWEHPDRGIVLPGAFLPAVSAAGLNERLSEIMLFHALAAVKQWDEDELGVPSVGVNLSSDELSDPKLCEKIQWELDRFGLAPHRLTIEVLETVIATSANETITRNIAHLAHMGCKIDLDDFGTGHASIANIRRFQVNRIKIDRSFVTCVDTDRQQQQMLAAILEMAGRLDIETLAEGVETSGEHTLLAQLGCAHVQGYSIAAPMPAEQLVDWLKSLRAELAQQPRIAGGASG